MKQDIRNRESVLPMWMAALLFGVLSSVPFLLPHFGWVSLFSFVPLFVLDTMCRENDARHPFLIIYCAFLLFNIGSTFWIWFVSEVGAIAALALNSLQMALIFSLFRWSRKMLSRRGVNGMFIPYLLLVVMWTGWEHIYFNIELSWPWLVLGNAFATSLSLVQWYDITGSLGGSLWILVSNILIYETIAAYLNGNRGRRRALAAAAALVLAVPSICSIIRFNNYEEKGESVEMAVLQPNVDPFLKYGYVPQDKLDADLIHLMDSVLTPDTRYVITPETFTYNVNLDYPLGNPSFRLYSDYLQQHPDLTMVLGALTFKQYDSCYKPTCSARKGGGGWYDLFNSAIVADAAGRFEYYHKSKLVPGVEIIPYQRYLPFIGNIIEKCGGSSNSYGVSDKMKALPCGDGNKVAAMICYESVYGEYSRRAVKDGATFMAVMTNDGWWGDTPGYRQHFRYASLRAIETRRDVVHAANTGISGFINQKGDVLSRTDWWVMTAQRGEVRMNSELTPFVKYGDIIGTACAYLCPVLFLFLVVFSIVRRRVS